MSLESRGDGVKSAAAEVPVLKAVEEARVLNCKFYTCPGRMEPRDLWVSVRKIVYCSEDRRVRGILPGVARS